jgi:hypothetical protein
MRKSGKILAGCAGLRAAVLGAFLLAGSGCFRPETATAEIRVPALRSEIGAVMIGQALSTFPKESLKSHSADWRTHTLRVTYDSTKIELRNIQHRLADAGFAADDLPPNEDARRKLPPDCQ